MATVKPSHCCKSLKCWCPQNCQYLATKPVGLPVYTNCGTVFILQGYKRSLGKPLKPLLPHIVARDDAANNTCASHVSVVDVMDVSVIVLEVAVTVLAQADVQGLGRRKLCNMGAWFSDRKQKVIHQKIKKTYFG